MFGIFSCPFCGLAGTDGRFSRSLARRVSEASRTGRSFDQAAVRCHGVQKRFHDVNGEFVRFVHQHAAFSTAILTENNPALGRWHMDHASFVSMKTSRGPVFLWHRPPMLGRFSLGFGTVGPIDPRSLWTYPPLQTT